jgi:hypothetical protein
MRERKRERGMMDPPEETDLIAVCPHLTQGSGKDFELREDMQWHRSVFPQSLAGCLPQALRET